MDRLRNQKLPFSKKKLPKRVLISYVSDYFIILILGVAIYYVDKIEPFHQRFSMKNYTLHYPFAVEERVPVPMLVVLACLIPIIIMAIYTLVIDGLFSHQVPTTVASGRRRVLAGRYRFKDRLWELNCAILGIFLSCGAAFVITGSLKIAIGKPRPDLIDRCLPRDGITDDPTPLTLTAYTVCTQTDQHILDDGFKSFPSGHSSTAFGGLFYLSLYLAAKLHIFDSKGEVWKTFLVILPTLGAALIAGSRIMDARHHPFDVISGSLLGVLTAWGSYRQYFPPVSETWRKGRAYPIRSWGKSTAPPPVLHADDDSVPLQQMAKPADLERHGSGSSSGVDGRNVFRAQVAATQRQRDAQTASPVYVAPAPGYAQAASTDSLPRREQTQSSTYSQQPAGHNLFLPVPTRHERYDESSSEDDDTYNMQRQYTLSNPARNDTINPYESNYPDTSYPSQTVPLNRPTMPAKKDSMSGDMGVRPADTPRLPPQQANQRGVQLTETYAS